MQQGISPEKFTFFPVLHAMLACTLLKRQGLSMNIENSHELDTDNLADMYERCRSMEDAWSVQ